MLPSTKAQNVEERRDELVKRTNDEYFKIVSYTEYDKFPEVKLYNEKAENIRFFPDGLEVLVRIGISNRVIRRGGGEGNIEQSPVDTTHTFQLIDEKRKKILEYSIDGIKGEY